MKQINFNGYIEGYYGKVLNWSERKLIIKSLNTNNLNFYFYAPKDDQYHRKEWESNYPKDWLLNFKKFCQFAKKFKIKIISGISPGLTYCFEKLSNKSFVQNSQFQNLVTKIQVLIDYGSDYICLLLDDIPVPKNNLKKISEGKIHAILANALEKKFKKKILFVPRVYANELKKTNYSYLHNLSQNINANIPIFYCGPKIVSTRINKKFFNGFNSLFKNKLIIWDNNFANDYCPRRLFLDPNNTPKNNYDIMYNMTGLVHTDLLLLDLVNVKNYNSKSYFKIFSRHGVPRSFTTIHEYFSHTNNQKKIEMDFKLKIKAIDDLLWDWKSPLALEWYPYLLGLKQDLILSLGLLSKSRIFKTQTKPLSKFLTKL